MGCSFTSEAIRRGAGGNEGKRVSSGYNRRRRLATRSSGKQQAERTAVRAAPIVCPEESPQCARRRTPLPPAGLDAPTPAQEQGLQPYGALYCFEGRTEGFQRASGKPFGAPAGAYPRPRWGITRRLRRGLGLAVPRGAHTFLSVAKEKCAKESQRHGDSRGGPPRFALRPSPALRLSLATRFMAFGHFWR